MCDAFYKIQKKSLCIYIYICFKEKRGLLLLFREIQHTVSIASCQREASAVIPGPRGAFHGPSARIVPDAWHHIQLLRADLRAGRRAVILRLSRTHCLEERYRGA